jgi:hypothetical protein
VRPAHGARARSSAVAILGAVALSLLTACGSSRQPNAHLELVPAEKRDGPTWRWTSQCTLEPAARTGCQAASPILGFAQLNGDAWNLGGPAGGGSLDMAVASDGAVAIAGHFAAASPCTASTCLAPSANTWVRGYPNVLYGLNQCYADTSPRPSPELPLPIRLDAIPPRLVGVTAYSTEISRVSYDVAYDLWLNPTGTKRPCRAKGTLEILVMTDYSAHAVLPPELEAGTAQIPVALAGAKAHPQPWSIYASNIGGNGWTQPWGGTIWFVPDRANVVARGRVSVDLSAVLAAAGRVLHRNYGWADPAKRYWLDTVSFGVEFGPSSGDPYEAGPLRFSARISAYCLLTGTTVERASCG